MQQILKIQRVILYSTGGRHKRTKRARTSLQGRASVVFASSSLHGLLMAASETAACRVQLAFPLSRLTAAGCAPPPSLPSRHVVETGFTPAAKMAGAIIAIIMTRRHVVSAGHAAKWLIALAARPAFSRPLVDHPPPPAADRRRRRAR